MSKKNIESTLLEQRSFPPPRGFAARARLKPRDVDALRREAAADHLGFWAGQARAELRWHKPFTVTLDDSAAPNYRWFTDGELNVSYNCLDVHLEERGHKTAIICEGEPGDARRSPTASCSRSLPVRQCAARAQGVSRGDRVLIYMPMVPEAAIAMQACARIGAVHSVVFGGFSALSCAIASTTPGPRSSPPMAAGGAGRSWRSSRWSTRRCVKLQTRQARDRASAAAATRSRWRPTRLWWHEEVAAGFRRTARPRPSIPSIRSSSSTPRARPASRRASCTRPAVYLTGT